MGLICTGSMTMLSKHVAKTNRPAMMQAGIKNDLILITIGEFGYEFERYGCCA
jgi:hypothetical protein